MIERRTTAQITADTVRMAKYLATRSPAKRITSRQIVQGSRFSDKLQHWVTSVLARLANEGLVVRVNRTVWEPTPSWTSAHVSKALGVDPGDARLEQAQPAAVTPPAPPAPRVREPLRTDQFQRALKAEYFDRLVTKYGVDVIKDALGVSTLP